MYCLIVVFIAIFPKALLNTNLSSLISGGEHEIVPENNELFLTCERNFFLYTNDAVYGYYCATVSTGVEGVETCFSANSKEIVSSICNYQQNCTVEASDEVFDSNCTEAQKYLRVSYVCIRGK